MTIWVGIICEVLILWFLREIEIAPLIQNECDEESDNGFDRE